MGEVELKIQALRAEADRLEREKRLMENLPLCPFCGGKPRILETTHPWDLADCSGKSGRFSVICEGCGCSTKECKDEGDAVRSWRRRIGG